MFLPFLRIKIEIFNVMLMCVCILYSFNQFPGTNTHSHTLTHMIHGPIKRHSSQWAPRDATIDLAAHRLLKLATYKLCSKARTILGAPPTTSSVISINKIATMIYKSNDAFATIHRNETTRHTKPQRRLLRVSSFDRGRCIVKGYI